MRSEKLMQLADELYALAFVSDQFTRIEEGFNDIEPILNTRLDRYVDLLELFQRGYMEIENIQDEIREQLYRIRNFIFVNAEHEEEEWKERAMVRSYKCPLCGAWPLLRTDGIGRTKYRVSCKCEYSFLCEDSLLCGGTVEEAVIKWRARGRLVCKILKKEYREESRSKNGGYID